jgi:hypothetical protein
MWKSCIGCLGYLALTIVVPILTVGAMITVLNLSLSEDICFDRWPWWGPPDSNSSPDCSGHIYQRRQAGYGWFGGPR